MRRIWLCSHRRCVRTAPPGACLAGCLPDGAHLQLGEVIMLSNVGPRAGAAAGATLVSIFVGVPLIKRKVQRDWEELSKPEAIPELQGAVPASAGDSKVSQLGPGVQWEPGNSFEAWLSISSGWRPRAQHFMCATPHHTMQHCMCIRCAACTCFACSVSD